MFKKEIIGLMSGTSLDGLDIAHVEFVIENTKTRYFLKSSQTIPYPDSLHEKLQSAHSLDISELQILDKTIGAFFAEQVNSFISNNKIDKDKIDAIASHGQTILHQPENGFTLQIGCGSTLAYSTGIMVVNDFRTLDVIAGGQGAPLVPLGDFELFFEEAESFLNIGGFCNISYKDEEGIQAFDICPGNLPLNNFANKLGHEFDLNGEIAEQGNLNNELLQKLNSLEFYSKNHPKSLGTEWLEKNFYTNFSKSESPENLLHTVCVHITQQIINCLEKNNIKSVLVTGGGAKNKFLMRLISEGYNGDIIIPKNEIIDYKEAIVFAYLGFKYLSNQPNNVISVTGAQRNLCMGVLHKPGY